MMDFKDKKILIKHGLAYGLPAIFVVAMIIHGMHSSSSQNNRSSFNPTSAKQDTSTFDTPTETLKTISSQEISLQDRIQSVLSENKKLREQNNTKINAMRQDDKRTLGNTVNTLSSEIEGMKEKQASEFNKKIKGLKEYPLHGQIAAKTHDNVWINDLSSTPASDNNFTSMDASLLHPKGKKKVTADDILGPRNNGVTPYFTLPENATLTGAVAMQPLVGRIPVNNRVQNPYSFKVVLGAKNLATNGVAIPPDIKGVVVRGVATGDLLASCVRGNIVSMTFTFADGTISTTDGTEMKPLGTIASAGGSPCIPGKLHTNAAEYLGISTGLAAIGGYGAGIAQAAMINNVSSQTGNVSSVVKEGNKYAMGRALTSSTGSAQKWWDDRVKDSFDFIFVPNFNPKTGKYLILNINLTQQININKDKKSRRVSYERNNAHYHFSQLD